MDNDGDNGDEGGGGGVDIWRTVATFEPCATLLKECAEVARAQSQLGCVSRLVRAVVPEEGWPILQAALEERARSFSDE